VRKIFEGLGYNTRGLSYYFSHRSLWKFSLIPLTINLLTLILMVSLYLHFFGEIFAFISSPLGSIDIVDPQSWYWHIADGALWFIRNLLRVVFFVIALVVIVVMAYFLSSFINSPFYEMMVEKILIVEGLMQDVPFSFTNFKTNLLHSLKIETFKLLFFVSISVCLVVLSFIPLVGTVFSILGFFFAAWTFAFGLCGYSLMLKRTDFRNMLRWGLSNKLTLIGFGLPAMIPFLGMIMMNFQVVGGTLLYIKKSTTPSEGAKAS
jgi:CysZ protein